MWFTEDWLSDIFQVKAEGRFFFLSTRHASGCVSALDARAPSASDGATVTIQDILQSCNIAPDSILNCLAKLRASWTTGMADSLAGLDCNSVAIDLLCFLQQNCSGAPSSKDFNEAAAFLCPPVIIYAGVRFV